MFNNNNINYENNYEYYCNLTINNTTMMFNNININNNNKFCTNLCQSWINKIEQFSLDCPNDCDEWKTNINNYNLCKIYWNSLDSLKQTSMEC